LVNGKKSNTAEICGLFSEAQGRDHMAKHKCKVFKQHFRFAPFFYVRQLLSKVGLRERAGLGVRNFISNDVDRMQGRYEQALCAKPTLVDAVECLRKLVVKQHNMIEQSLFSISIYKLAPGYQHLKQLVSCYGLSPEARIKRLQKIRSAVFPTEVTESVPERRAGNQVQNRQLLQFAYNVASSFDFGLDWIGFNQQHTKSRRALSKSGKCGSYKNRET
jgi:hypothetical protein